MSMLLQNPQQLQAFMQHIAPMLQQMNASAGGGAMGVPAQAKGAPNTMFGTYPGASPGPTPNNMFHTYGGGQMGAPASAPQTGPLNPDGILNIGGRGYGF